MNYCGAKARTNNHNPCKNLPMRGKQRCRLHGGKSCGASKKGLKRIKEANTKHGFYSSEMIAERQLMRDVLKAGHARIENISKSIGF